MAEPLSFVSSVIAVAALAEGVVTRGYRYLKAVKNCADEVRNLMAETNVLCGILGRLRVLLADNRSKSEATVKSKENAGQDLNDDDEISDEVDVVSSEDEVIQTFDYVLHPPDFIYQCQSTLHEIDNILKKFQHTTISKSRFKVTKFRRMDLTWPLRKSETMQLIEALERHKSTCTLALAGNGLAEIHTVLEQTRFSNKCLTNLMAKQEKLFELNITHEQEESLAWLSSVNPASKLQGFRRERQRGTGRWLFDLPEMSAWLRDSNSALWIYGIPGAGKTILSTLVVDEMLIRKRSTSIGTAYFYIRHDDKNSQIFSNVLGSFISQLARQNSAALDDVMKLYQQRRREGSLITDFEDDDLIRHLFEISKNFVDTFIMVDGLDECGSPYDRNRNRLINALAQIHQNRTCRIHTLIFSRDELDIRKCLTATKFKIISIAARSADLRLYVNAWLPSLEIQNETLKIEIVDTLVEKAQGMFMWVRAQVDYLQRLPNDKEKRSALKNLPPDLPQTYVRIFEIIDSTYPIQTTKFIQRLLKWLVLSKSNKDLILKTKFAFLSLRVLCQAICIEDQSDRLLDIEIPTEEQILGWLGCLIRKSKYADIIELSHFTIKEFLRTDPENVFSAVARKYLVQPEDYNYLLKGCLIHVMQAEFSSMTCSNSNELLSLIRNHPLYAHATVYLLEYVFELTVLNTGINQEVQCIMQRFLSIPVHKAFRLWDKCWAGVNLSYPIEDLEDEYCSEIDPPEMENFISPLHFASATGLVDEVQRLLTLGLDPNSTSLATIAWEFTYTPLHLALVSIRHDPAWICDRKIYIHDPELNEAPQPEKSLQTIRTLLKAGADVNRQLATVLGEICAQYIMTPLILTLVSGFWQAACILLDSGADCDARAHETPQGFQDLCSIEAFLDEKPDYEESVQRTVDFGGHRGLKLALARWRDKYEEGSDSQSTEKNNDHFMEDINYSTSPQECLSDAYRDNDWLAVRELLNTASGIEINCNDEHGTNLLYCIANGSSEDLRWILERGANPNLLPISGYSGLCKTVVSGCFENMSLLLEFGANIEHRDPGGWTPLLCAIWSGRREMVERLLDEGANPDAVLDDGADGIHLAIQQKDTDMFSLLLERGLLPASADNYGSTPLHVACKQGLQFEGERLIEVAPDRVNDVSLINGTPLYVAAKWGFVSLVRTLLDAGAAIDKTGPGNLLGSALMVACADGQGETVKLLLSRGASCEVEGSRFLSAAGTARAFRQEKILKILEEHSHNMSEAEHI